MTHKTIGSNEHSDLLLRHDSVAGSHATALLRPDGSILVTSAGPEAMVWLLRGERRQRVYRVRLSLGDRLFFGDAEVQLSQLTALFGPTSGARLRQRPAAPEAARTPPQPPPAPTDRGPRRNPDTGAIEA